MKFALIIGFFPKPLKPCVVSSVTYSIIAETHFSIVSRLFSSIPSQIQQEIEFIRPVVEERFAKMEEYGDNWDDKPVCHILISGISPDDRFTERYADVADERGQGSREVRRRLGAAIAPSQFCIYPYNLFGK